MRLGQPLTLVATDGHMYITGCTTIESDVTAVEQGLCACGAAVDRRPSVLKMSAMLSRGSRLPECPCDHVPVFLETYDAHCCDTRGGGRSRGGCKLAWSILPPATGVPFTACAA